MDLNLTSSTATLEISSGQSVLSKKESRSEKDTVTSATTTEDGVHPDIQLSKTRFARVVLLTLAAFVILLRMFVHGVVIDTKVRDEFGSSSHANHWVEIYQVINGHVSAAIGKIVERSFEVFVVVAVMFLRNVRWFPGDEPSIGAGRVKRFLLWAFPRLIKFYMAVAFTAMYVGYKTSGVERTFLQRDLVLSSTASRTGRLNATAATNWGSGVSVLDTILRGAVTQQVAPFKMKFSSSCAAHGSFTSVLGLPSIKEVRSTTVVYGFPSNDWNADALPFGLRPAHTATFQSGDVKKSAANITKQFQGFQEKANVSWATMYELLLQSKLMYERSVSDSIPWQTYDCAEVNGGNKLQQDKSNAKKDKVCYGARSSLSDVANAADPRVHTMDAFLSIAVKGFMRTTDTPKFDNGSVKLTIDKYDINSKLKLTALTLDLPYAEQFLYTSNDTDIFKKYCDGPEGKEAFRAQYGGNVITTDQLEKRRAAYCNPVNAAYLDPRAGCGHTNCIFLDQSAKISFKKQLQLMPYLTNCSIAELNYDADYLNAFPQHCVQNNDTVFLFGLGSYMTAESFDSGYQTKVPFIVKPRRHIVVTFAKLEWEFQELNSAFGAECGGNSTTLNSRCQGLMYELEGSSRESEKSRRVLVLGENHLPATRMDSDYRNPVQLVSLNMRPLYYSSEATRYEWEYLNLKHINTTNWPETMKAQGGLNGTMCSPLVDSYIAQIEENHWYIDDPRQPLYTAALFYLFQNAAVKTVKLGGATNTMLGTTALKGDKERHDIRFSIPLLSLVSTFIGLGLFLFVAVMVIVYPTERLKMTEDAEENSAQRYDRFLQDENPAALFTRSLTLVSGDSVAADDYEVQSATLQLVDDKDEKIFL